MRLAAGFGSRRLQVEVYIDTGHGGTDPGAVSPLRKGPEWVVHQPVRGLVLEEAALCGRAAAALAEALTEAGIDHHLGEREPRAKGRVPLIEAWGEQVIARGNNPVVVSLHWNAAANPEASGVEVLVRPKADRGLGELVLAYTVETLAALYPVRVRGVREAQLAVLGPYPDTSFVLETAFLTNPFEAWFWAAADNEQLVQRYRQLAVAVRGAIVAMFGDPTSFWIANNLDSADLGSAAPS